MKAARLGEAFLLFFFRARGALGQGAQAQCVELDETLGVAVVVGHRSFLESYKLLIIKGVMTLRPTSIALPL